MTGSIILHIVLAVLVVAMYAKFWLLKQELKAFKKEVRQDDLTLTRSLRKLSEQHLILVQAFHAFVVDDEKEDDDE